MMKEETYARIKELQQTISENLIKMEYMENKKCSAYTLLRLNTRFLVRDLEFLYHDCKKYAWGYPTS